MTYFRKNIDEMAGYKPGEQPRMPRLVKLNTNENPYPVSPKARLALAEFAGDLRLYPDPVAKGCCMAAADFLNVSADWVIAGNGSDDILTMVMRAFVGEGDKVAFPEPSYSLYPVLADIQGGAQVPVPLTADFQLPENALELLEGAKLFLIPNPNAPTGNLFNREKLREICAGFDGIVLIDEAYADFAEAHCVALAEEFDNVIISRTLSKSFSLAGARFGFAVARPELIAGLMKVKDSYNVNGLTQVVAEAALRDVEYMEECRDRVIASRQRLTTAFRDLGMHVLESQTNFLFVNPIKCSAEHYFQTLRSQGIITRYFPAPATADYVRITIGTDEQMKELLEATVDILNAI